MRQNITLDLDITTQTSGNAEQVAQLIGAAAWHISGDYLVVEDCALNYRVTDNETYVSVGMTKIPNGTTVELWEGEQPISYDLGEDSWSITEKQIEQEIQEKGINAPRLTPEHIDKQIVSEIYITGRDAIDVAAISRTGFIKSEYKEGVDLLAPAETLTFCILILRNGFTVTGESACASPENFNAEIGRKVARDNAREKIWMLEGYLLKEKLHQQSVEGQAK